MISIRGPGDFDLSRAPDVRIGPGKGLRVPKFLDGRFRGALLTPTPLRVSICCRPRGRAKKRGPGDFDLSRAPDVWIDPCRGLRTSPKVLNQPRDFIVNG